MIDRIKAEPAIILALVQSVIALVVAFGLELTAEQIGAILALTAAVLGLVTRQLVTPATKPPSSGGKTGTGTALLVFALAMGSSSCAMFSDALDGMAKVAQGAQRIGSILQEAREHTDLFFQRHPNLEAKSEIDLAFKDARAALSAYEALVAAAEAVDAGDLTAGRDRLLDAVGIVRALLERHGVLSGTPPAGGADGFGPAF